MTAMAIAVMIAIGLLVGADVFADGDAAGHVRYHALSALVVLAIAVLAARRAGVGGRAAAPAIGLWVFAAAQLVEAVGGAGFNADNETRNELAVIHDLGLGVSAIGLVAAVLGISIGIGDALANRGASRGITVGGGAVILGLGLFAVKTLIGM
jgi:hypothetical protein